jgi:hypothetical protein
LEYQEEVIYVTEIALDFWEEILEGCKLGSSDDAQAIRKAWINRPAGPAAYPGLVALIREYWLACHSINQQVAENERVPPWVFLLGWLIDAGDEQAVSVLACMPYWPIGLDRDGNWV